MKIVMTLMVRDEADVIRPMLEHHLAQGVDTFVITDNGSVDGTTEILREFAASGFVDLRHDPTHRKQQGTTVTGMARDAYTEHGADWVLNADADEFWVPVDRSLTLRAALERIPKSLGAFPVPVIDMTGAPAMSGAGLGRLTYRDTRPVEDLPAIGLHAHSTPNVVHVGSASVTVVQGNHYVDIESAGEPDPSVAIEVLHVPWRSWAQFRQKVENAGRAYDSNPDLKPSPNHHGMRDWKKLQDGTLFGWYVARHPSIEERGNAHLRPDNTLTGLATDQVDDEIDNVAVEETRRLLNMVVAQANQIGLLNTGAAESRERIIELDSLLADETAAKKIVEHNADGQARELSALRATFAVRTASRLAPLRRQFRRR